MKYINYKIFENIQRAKSLLQKLEIPEDNKDFLQIRKMLQGKDGFVHWFVDQRFNKKESMESLEEVWQTILDSKKYLPLFSKPIIELETVEQVYDELEKSRIRMRVKQLYAQFPSYQKNLIDLDNEEDFELMNSLAQDKSKDAVIKKISSFKRRSDLIDAMQRFLEYKTEGTFDRIKEKIEACGSKIIYSNEDTSIIISKVNYGQVKELGGDTAWCIVGSEQTFNSYQKGISIQYIIFLLDETGMMSKIGLTINEGGYVTAHNKNDGYISADQIEGILKDRGFEMNNLLPGKDSITPDMFDRIEIPLLVEYGFSKEEIVKHKKNLYHALISDLIKADFTKEEIRKNKPNFNSEEFKDLRTIYTKEELSSKHKDFKQGESSVIDIFIVDQILESDFTIEEILKSKQMFLRDDLKHFTEEQIEEYKLLGKLSLHSTQLEYFNKDQIIRFDMIKRSGGNIPLLTFAKINFDVPEILKYKDRLAKLDLKILNKVQNKLKKKRNIKKYITEIIDSSWGLRDLFGWGSPEEKEIRDRDYEKEIRLALMILYNIVGDIGVGEVYGLLKEKNLDKYKNIINLIKIRPNTTNKELISVITDDVWKNTISLLSKFVFDLEEIQHKRDIHERLSKLGLEIIEEYFDERNYPKFELGKDELNQIEEYLVNHPDLYEKIFNKSYTVVSSNRYIIRVTDDDKSFSDINIEKTLENILFFGFRLTLTFLGSVFENEVNSYSLIKITDFLDEHKIEYKNHDGFMFIEKISKHDVKNLDRLDFNIEHEIEVEASYEMLINMISSQKGSYRDSEVKQIERLLTKSKEYSKYLESFNKREHINKGLEELLKTSGYETRRSYNNEKTLDAQEWYDKYYKEVSKINLNQSNYGETWDKYSYSIGLLLILARLGKTNLFNKIKYDFIKSTGSFNKPILKELCQVLANRNFYNQRQRWDFNLNMDEKKLILEWLESKIKPGTSEELYLQVCYFIFKRRTRLKNLIDRVKLNLMPKIRDYWNNDDDEKNKKIKNRLPQLNPLIEYLAEEHKWKSLDAIFKRFSDLSGKYKVGKIETKKIFDKIRPNLYHAKEKTIIQTKWDGKKEKVTRRSSDESSEKLQLLLSKHFGGKPKTNDQISREKTLAKAKAMSAGSDQKITVRDDDGRLYIYYPNSNKMILIGEKLMKWSKFARIK